MISHCIPPEYSVQKTTNWIFELWINRGNYVGPFNFDLTGTYSSCSCSNIDDDTRVILRKDDGLMEGDFINASYITVSSKAIILTPSTLRQY